MKTLIHFAGIATLAMAFAAPGAHATVVIGGTRVIVNAAQGEATVPVNNVSKQPTLIEAWIDKGNPRSTPDSAHTPFLITPPLARINPGKQQTLRIVFTAPAKPLPANRETLFWLNVLSIPPKPSGAAAHKNTLQFAVRSRLKVFYRPSGLPGSSFNAPNKLTFTATTKHGKVALKVHNPTPYYVTITKIALPTGSKPDVSASGMVAPFGNLTLAFKQTGHDTASGTKLTFSTINDYGAGVAHQAAVQQ